MLTGMVLIAGGLVTVATLTVDSGFLTIAIAFGLIGSGMGLAVAPASTAIVGTLSPDKVGAGSGLRSMVQLLGGIVRSGHHRQPRRDGVTAPTCTLRSPGRCTACRRERGKRSALRSGTRSRVAGTLPHGLAQATKEAANQAFVSGLRLAALVGVAVMVVSTVVAAIYVPAHVAAIDDVEARAFEHL